MSEIIPIFKFVLNPGLDSSFLPTRATDQDTGWDVRASENILIKAGEYAKIKLGFRAFCPAGWWLKLHPRSSSFTKKNLHALYGIIDESYEGQMIFGCQYVPNIGEHIPGTQLSLSILKGEAIGQLIPIRRQEMVVEQISDEEYERLCKDRGAARGAGGFGSTDLK